MKQQIRELEERVKRQLESEEPELDAETLKMLEQEILVEARALNRKPTPEQRKRIKDHILNNITTIFTPPAPGETLQQKMEEQVDQVNKTAIDSAQDAEVQLIPENMLTVLIQNVPLLFQFTQEWQKEEMGVPGSGVTYGAKGCALLCLTILANFYLSTAAQGLIKPTLLNDFFIKNDGWYQKYVTRWETLCTLFTRWNMSCTFHQKKLADEGTDMDDIFIAARAEIDADRPCILRLRHSRGPHFVVAIGYIQNQQGNITDWIIHDPGSGQGDGYGNPACTLWGNAAHDFDLEGCLIYNVSGTPVHPNQKAA